MGNKLPEKGNLLPFRICPPVDWSKSFSAALTFTTHILYLFSMGEDEKEGEFLTLSFLQELRHLCSRIGYLFSNFEVELDKLRRSLANPNLHDFQKELVGRLHAVPPGMYASPSRLMPPPTSR